MDPLPALSTNARTLSFTRKEEEERRKKKEYIPNF